MSAEKPIHDQLRRQGREALREMRTWPARKQRNLPPEWLEEEDDESSGPDRVGTSGVRAEDCDRYEDTDRWVSVCGDDCHCVSTLCGNCDEPLQFHRWPVKEAWFDSADGD